MLGQNTQGGSATALRIAIYLATFLVLTVCAAPRVLRAAAINRWSLYYASEVVEPESTQDVLAPPACHARAVFWQALAALRAGDDHRAGELLAPLASAGNRYALQLMAQTLELLGDFPGSVQAWTQAKDAPSLWKAAERAIEGSALDNAFLALSAARQLEPENGTTRLADFLRHQRRDYATAELVLEQALASFPSSHYRLEWLHDLADVLRAQQQWVQAATTYQRILTINRNDVEAHVDLGFVDYEQGDVEAALAEFHKAIALNPGRGSGYLAIAQVLAREKRYADANPWFELALERDPSPSWYLTYADAARKAGDLPRALDVYAKAIVRFPAYAPAYFEMAWVYRLENQPEQAIQSIEQALRLMAAPDGAYYVRAGQIYEFAGNPTTAIAAYRQALALDPNSKAAQEALARLSGAP